MSEEFYLGAIAEAWGITKDQGRADMLHSVGCFVQLESTKQCLINMILIRVDQ